MNEIFITVFVLIAFIRFDISALCLSSMLLFYLPLDDFWISAVSSVLMCVGVAITKGSVKILFWLAALIQMLSALSNYYYDYSNINSQSATILAYYVYLYFIPCAVTIYTLIALNAIRLGCDRINSIVAMLNSVFSFNRGNLSRFQDAKSSKEVKI